MATSQKALALAADIKDDLAVRFPSETVTLSYATGGAPIVTVGTKALVRIDLEASIGKNVIGMDQTVYTPHIAQVVLDGTADATGDIVAAAIPVSLAVLGDVLQRGLKTNLYIANAVSNSAIIDGNLVASFDSLKYPLVSSM